MILEEPDEIPPEAAAPIEAAEDVQEELLELEPDLVGASSGPPEFVHAELEEVPEPLLAPPIAALAAHPPPLARPPAAPPPLAPAAGLGVRAAAAGAEKFALPRWALAAGVAGTAFCFGLLGLIIGAASSSAPAETSGTSTSAQSEPAAGKATDSAKRPLLERARAGEAEALRQLEAKAETERAAAELLALARGKAELERRAVRALSERLANDPKLVADAKLVKELQRFAANELTATEALASMAALPGSIGADLIYEVWTGVADRTASTILAEKLVYSPDVLAKASPALRVALDLRSEQGCQQNLEILKRASEHGDRRSLHLLGRRLQKHGCGPAKRDDCYECLRKGDDLKTALQAVRARPGPKW